MLNDDRLRRPLGGATQAMGHVVSVRGSQARVGLLGTASPNDAKARATVGKFLGICTADSLLVGVITNVSTDATTGAQAHTGHAIADLDLVGEIKQAGAAGSQFHRGVAEYPAIGDPVLPINPEQLRM